MNERTDSYAYTTGYSAFRNGLQADEFPEDFGGEEVRQWKCGWFDARKAVSDERAEYIKSIEERR